MKLTSYQELVNSYLRYRLSYENLAYSTSKYLEIELRKKSIDVTYLTWRVKSLHSILEKIKRKKYAAELSNIKDIAGIRIVIPYLSSLQKTIDLVSETFDVLELENTMFREGITSFGYTAYHCIVKWKEQSSAPMNSYNFNQEDVYAIAKSFKIDEKTELESIITRNNRNALDNLLTFYNKKLCQFPFEIQIRTTLQDSWDNLSHYIIYKNEKNVSEVIKRKLARLAALLEEVDEEFNNQISDSSIYQRKQLFYSINNDNRLDIKYLSSFSKNVLNIESSIESLNCSFQILTKIGIKTIKQFENLIIATITAIDRAFNTVYLIHLRMPDIYLILYFQVCDFWLSEKDKPDFLVPSQYEIINRFRYLVNDEYFVKVKASINQ